MAALVLIAAFALLMLAGAVKDIQSFTIPNWICIAAAALFVPAAAIAGLGWAGFAAHLAVGFAVLLLGMGLFAMRWLGGGDAKLLAAAALWAGWPDVLMFLAYVAALGGVFTLLLMAARRAFGPAAQHAGLSLPILERAREIPYGVAIAGAALIFLPRADIGAALISAAA